MNKQMKLKLLQEKKRREKLFEYKENFEKFATEQIKILPKDPTRGFISFEFNEAQQQINNFLEKQRQETGRVRAIILKARRQGTQERKKERTTTGAQHRKGRERKGGNTQGSKRNKINGFKF